MADIMRFLEEKKGLIDGEIMRYFPKRLDIKYLEWAMGKAAYEYDLEALNGALATPIWDFLGRGGKRWRPALFLLITEALGGDPDKVKDFVIIPELAHEGSIMIDDIEDKGEMRRGRPCTHRLFGQDVAINAGSIMYFLPLLAFVKNRKRFDEKTLIRAYEAYAEEMIRIHIGQATDIYWHKGKASGIREAQYFQMCAYKTGCLARMAARLAVVLSGGSREQEEKIGRIGENLGIAFQIRDDLLSLGDEGEKFTKGKGFGDDITEGKRSLAVIHTLKAASQQDRKRLLELLDMHTTENSLIREAIGIITKYNAIEYAKGKARELVERTWKDADPLLPASEAKEKLHSFIRFAIERDI
ncbi:MAG: polyprenyl synthetase family protein [Candidatus Aenigmarchaeota archaeon]|nr:polyprenyl synthetase family protein [Candidatus Aenigmarchaeota archaeon]